MLRGTSLLARFRAFTLLEILVSVSILAVILVAMLSLVDMTSKSYSQGNSKIDAFEASRAAFDAMARTVHQATLLSYLGYDDPKAPTKYQLKSDLHFISGPQGSLNLVGLGAGQTHAIFFQTPLGISDLASLRPANLLIGSTGFFIAYGPDPIKPDILDDKTPADHRYRLFQFLQPREQFDVYRHTLGEDSGVVTSNENFQGADWYKNNIEAGLSCHPLANNVVALAILPVYGGTSAPSYLWNSRDRTSIYTHNRLPQALKIVMAVIDEKSAARISGPTAPSLYPADLFTDASSFDDDVQSLELALSEIRPKIEFRIFTSEIALNPAESSL